jgi:four helix bundle protein
MPRDVGGQIMARQLARSGTSIGANVEEAQCAQSKAEFARKMNIALSEARETWYWLRLLSEEKQIPVGRLRLLIQESVEIVKVLTTIVKNSRKGQRENEKSRPSS